VSFHVNVLLSRHDDIVVGEAANACTSPSATIGGNAGRQGSKETGCSDAGGVQRDVIVRIWTVLLACLLLPNLAAAQPAPSVSELEAGLRSTSITEVAWAAFRAGAFEVTETVPALATALQSPPPGSQQEREYLAAAILDALAQMPFWPGRPGVTEVEPTAVAAHFDRWPLQTVVVLGRIGPAADPVALDLLRSWPARPSLRMGDAWFAIANLLIARAPIGFASLLLRDISFELHVTVRDQGEGAGLGSGYGGGAGADGIAQKPAAFPPHAEYQWDAARAGSILMSSGPRTLYYRRVLSWRDQFGVAFRSSTVTGDDRLQYVAAIAHRAGPFALRERTDQYLIWNGPDGFIRKVRGEQQRIATLYTLILTELVAAGRLTREEADALPPHLVTVIDDARSKRTPPLPAVP